MQIELGSRTLHACMHSRSFVHNALFLRKTIMEREPDESENRKRRDRPCRLNSVNSLFAERHLNLLRRLIRSLFCYVVGYNLLGDFSSRLLCRPTRAPKTKSSPASPAAATVLVIFFRLRPFRQNLVSFLNIKHTSGAES